MHNWTVTDIKAGEAGRHTTVRAKDLDHLARLTRENHVLHPDETALVRREDEDQPCALIGMDHDGWPWYDRLGGRRTKMSQSPRRTLGQVLDNLVRDRSSTLHQAVREGLGTDEDASDALQSWWGRTGATQEADAPSEQQYTVRCKLSTVEHVTMVVRAQSAKQAMEQVLDEAHGHAPGRIRVSRERSIDGIAQGGRACVEGGATLEVPGWARFPNRRPGDDLPAVTVKWEEIGEDGGMEISEALVRTGLVTSRSEGARLLSGGGVLINDKNINAQHERIDPAWFDRHARPHARLKLGAGRKRAVYLELVD